MLIDIIAGGYPNLMKSALRPVASDATSTMARATAAQKLHVA